MTLTPIYSSRYIHCLAKVQWTGQTKNCISSVRLCFHASAIPCFRVLSATSCSPHHLLLHLLLSGQMSKQPNNKSREVHQLVITIPLCQTSCPLRTVHSKSVNVISHTLPKFWRYNEVNLATSAFSQTLAHTTILSRASKAGKCAPAILLSKSRVRR